MKNENTIGWIIVLLIIFTSTIFYIKLDGLSEDINNSQLPKLMITDNKQFDNLCKQFTEQWGAKDYAVYILQPNSKLKTHKELASATISNLPIMLKIEDYVDMEYKDGYYLGDSESFKNNISIDFDINSNYVMIPIYRHSIVVAEFYFTYDNLPSNLESKVIEAQTLSQVIR